MDGNASAFLMQLHHNCRTMSFVALGMSRDRDSNRGCFGGKGGRGRRGRRRRRRRRRRSPAQQQLKCGYCSLCCCVYNNIRIIFFEFFPNREKRQHGASSGPGPPTIPLELSIFRFRLINEGMRVRMTKM
jgi:hypothetical protein